MNHTHVVKQPVPLSAADQMNRRDFLRATSVATAGSCLLACGCVPIGSRSTPQLVWGRRGFSEGRFLKPRAITIDPHDQLYIVDTTGRIQVFDVDGNFLRSWKTPRTKNGRPTGLAVRPVEVAPSQPRLLVADTHYYQMLSYTLEGELKEDERIGGSAGHLPGEFAFVTDAVCDLQGCYYIGEYGDSDRIQKFDPEGGFLTQWGGTGQQPGQFVRPQSLLIRDQILWVVDACNHRIQRYDIRESIPRLIDIWGRQGVGKGEFFYPYDIALASDNTVLVIEYKNQRIQRLDPNGKWIATWGGPGFEPGQLNQPWGLVVDSQDRVHVLDSNNHRVQRIQLPS